MPIAEVVVVGTEILLGDIVDTNSQALSRAFAEFGIEHKRRSVVGDHLGRCAASIREALGRADLVVTIGGLGPTEDDVTREAIAEAVGEPLVTDADAEAELRAYVLARNRPWLDGFARQAMRPEGAACIPNDAGTAPGIDWQRGGKRVIAMPGPRNEFARMLDAAVRPALAAMSDGALVSRTVRIVGIPEAALGEMFREAMSSENPTVAPYTKVGEVHLRVSAKAASAEEAAGLCEPVVREISNKLGRAAYSTDGSSLAEAVVAALAARAETVAVAESCTGGLLGAMISAAPGASKALVGGFITYANDLKERYLGVDPEDLRRHGAVSDAVAEQMAEGARSATGATYGVGITGIAGPEGGTDDKPVGLVFVAVAGPEGVEVERCQFRGGREHIRELSAMRGLEMIWRATA